MSSYGLNFLKELVHYRTYAATLGNRKESRFETIERTRQMHHEMFPNMAAHTDWAIDFVHKGMVVPSMRSMQFAGDAIKRENVRNFNCSYHPVFSFKCIADIMYILCCGAGNGYSVQKMFVDNLPTIENGTEDELFVIPDSKEGWADSVLKLLKNPKCRLDYSQIRPAGSKLSTGGTASGPEPLIECHARLRAILKTAMGRKLRPIEVHDIVCHVADSVIVGGVRRSALICLFDPHDDEMLNCKAGQWWKKNAQRGRANNSAVLHRADPEIREKIRNILNKTFENQTGEPGIYLTNDYEYGSNPCCEISLKSFCNLSEVNVSACKTPVELVQAVRAATILGTLQAGYTNFNYISKDWQDNAIEEALLGVSFTGQAMNWDILTKQNLAEASRESLSTNEIIAKQMGINLAHRIGCTKPAGSSSAWLGTTSGIHAAYFEFGLRRVRVDKSQPIARYLINQCGLGAPNSYSVVEQDQFIESNIVVSVPVNYEHGIQRRDEKAVDLLKRVRHMHQNWIQPTHRQGPNTHNVSVTVSYRPEEIEEVTEWMIENRDSYCGIALLPYDPTTYPQAPFEEASKSQFQIFEDQFRDLALDLSKVDFSGSIDERKHELACAGGVCEFK